MIDTCVANGRTSNGSCIIMGVLGTQTGVSGSIGECCVGFLAGRWMEQVLYW